MSVEESVTLRVARAILESPYEVQNRETLRAALPAGATHTPLLRSMKRTMSGTGSGSKNSVTTAFQSALRTLEKSGYLTRDSAVITVIDREGLAQFVAARAAEEETWSW